MPPAVEDLTTGLLGKSLAACFFVSAFLFVWFWRHWVFVAVCGLSLVAASGGYSIVVRSLLTAVVSRVAEHGLLACGLQ